MEFIASSKGEAGKSRIAGCPLVFPVVSIGNVGQLAVDLVLATALSAGRARHVGYIETSLVGAAVGYEGYHCSSKREGAVQSFLTVGLEVFLVDGVAFVQQRVPVLPGRERDFAVAVLALAAAEGATQVLLLAGADAVGAVEGRVGEAAVGAGLQMAYSSVSPANEQGSVSAKLSELGLPKLAALERDPFRGTPLAPEGVGWVGHVLTGRTASAVSPTALAVTVMLFFCNEGDNTPHALGMAEAVKQCLGLFPPVTETAAQGTEGEKPGPVTGWRTPKSWNHLYGGDTGGDRSRGLVY